MQLGAKETKYAQIVKKSKALATVGFRIDGGVSRNDFVVQLIADLTGKTIERRTSSEMSAFGIAFLAGLYSGDLFSLLSSCSNDRVAFSMRLHQT